uniref:Transcription initiation factor TFIID subunit 2 n=1 Tax=Romanomermis culicivorax TaxID=13658 RepID=A0A915HKH3_ROMCU
MNHRSRTVRRKMKIERQKTIDSPRDFKVMHQTLCINSIDFETRNLFGYTELAILPLVKNLRSIRLDCSKQCRINRVTVQETIDTAFIHDDPFSTFRDNFSSGREQTRSFSSFFAALQSCADKCDADRNGGNLLIKFPYEIFDLADEHKLIRIGIEFNVEKPTSGLKFIFHPKLEGASWREKASHVYTYREPGHISNNCSWFPCVDAYSELCAWKIEVSLDTALTAVCSGELQKCHRLILKFSFFAVTYGVSYSSDLRRKNFVFSLNVPTPACNIGICIGVFDIFVHPDMNELSAFCPPQLLPLLKLTCQNLHKVFEFFEELLSSRYPYGSMKICFVDDLPILNIHSSALSYSTLILLNVKCLYHKKIIDQVPLTRTAMASGLASQFFGCYLVQRRFEDSWVCYGLASYLANMYCQKAFGNNEYMYQIYEDISQLVEYESKWGPVILNEYGEEDNKADIRKKRE